MAARLLSSRVGRRTTVNSTGATRSHRLARPAALCVAVVVALALAASSTDYVVGLLALMGIYATVLLAWNLIFGYGGVVVFGQLAFFALGAYGAAIANLHLGMSPWEDIWFGGLIAAVAGLAIGLPSLRLSGPYMILFTLAFQLALAALLPNLWTNVTGGSEGIYSGIGSLTLPGVSSITVTADVGIVLVVITYLVIAAILRSPIGHAIEALREGSAQAEARGISFVQHRVIVFTVSAFFTGLAGGLYTHFSLGVTPAVLDVGLLINLFAMLALGGVGSRVGPILGAVIGVYVNDRLSAAGEYSQLIWGGILLVTVMVAPGGLVGVFSAGAEKLRTGIWSRDDATRSQASGAPGEASEGGAVAVDESSAGQVTAGNG